MLLEGLLDEQHSGQLTKQLGGVGRPPQLGIGLDHRLARCPPQLWLWFKVQGSYVYWWQKQ